MTSRALICSGDHFISRCCCTQSRSSALPASLAVFGRRARSSASACARSARYRFRGPFRSTSRLMVDAGRPIRAPITRYDSPRASPIAISSRSASDKYRPDTGPGPFDFTPPARANHRSAPLRMPIATPASRGDRPDRTAPRTPPALAPSPAYAHPTSQRHPTSENRYNHQLNSPLRKRTLKIIRSARRCARQLPAQRGQE